MFFKKSETATLRDRVQKLEDANDLRSREIRRLLAKVSCLEAATRIVIPPIGGGACRRLESVPVKDVVYALCDFNDVYIQKEAATPERLILEPKQ